MASPNLILIVTHTKFLTGCLPLPPSLSLSLLKQMHVLVLDCVTQNTALRSSLSLSQRTLFELSLSFSPIYLESVLNHFSF